MLKKFVVGGLFTIGLIVAAFIFLLRACLSQYDERSIISKPLIFSNSGQSVFISLVKYDKATSYSSNGGFVRKTVSTSYFLQSNDLAGGDVIKEEFIKKHYDIKSYPIEMLGASGNAAWLFAGELMAFDAFSLEKIADTKTIEEKNPGLKNKLAGERRFYDFNPATGEISITVNDGSKYLLNTSTMVARPVDEHGETKDPAKATRTNLEKELRKIHGQSDALFARFRNNSRLFSQRQMSQKAYLDSNAVFNSERKALDKLRDSMYTLQREIDEELRYTSSRKNAREWMQRDNASYTNIQVNSDTFHGRWYGLYTANDLDNLYERFDYRATNNDAARTKLYTAAITAREPQKKFSDWIIGAERTLVSEEVYLQGGFLLDKETALPIHLSNPDGFLVVSKDRIGYDGHIVITAINLAGTRRWTVNTGLKEFAHWQVGGNELIVTGRDHKELGSGENNVLHIIDLRNGKVKTFDYFHNKKRG
jgi:hypothetical protein